MLGRINSFRADPTAYMGAVVMLGFSAWAGWRWFHTGLLFFLLLLVRDVVAAWFLVTRRPNMAEMSVGRAEWLAYLSCALPLFYFAPTHSHGFAVSLLAGLLPIAGFTLATVALFDLGESFGISPANRGRIGSGIYQKLSHPMYLGYVVAELGLVLLNPVNVVIWCTSIALYYSRALRELAVLDPRVGAESTKRSYF